MRQPPFHCPLLPHPRNAPYNANGTIDETNVNTGSLTWADMNIIPQQVLTDTVSISLTKQFLTSTPQWPMSASQPASILGTRAIRTQNNPLKYKSLKTVTFAETAYSLSGYTRDIWERSGGVSTLGFPVSEPFVIVNPETGLQVIMQYTEHGRIEQPLLKDGTLGTPQLGRLGAEVLATIDPFPAAALPVSPPNINSNIEFFAETRHTLQGGFADYFKNNGGLAQNGYPLTEPFVETYAEYPYPVIVQYFERVRMEFHSDPADPLYGQMTLGRIGAAALAANQP